MLRIKPNSLGIARMSQRAITPPKDDMTTDSVLTAQTMLRSQAAALVYLASLYETDPWVQAQFERSISVISDRITGSRGAKIVVTGMGKSLKIGDKLCATMNSLGIPATALHPCDALHGDLGIVGPQDVLLVVTSSGRTPEITALLPHIPPAVAIVCLTNSRLDQDSELARRSSVLLAQLPAEVSEQKIYGVAAPTFSTTSCLVVGDAMCVCICERLYTTRESLVRRFHQHHPGGAIGLAVNGNGKGGR